MESVHFFIVLETLVVGTAVAAMKSTTLAILFFPVWVGSAYLYLTLVPASQLLGGLPHRSGGETLGSRATEEQGSLPVYPFYAFYLLRQLWRWVSPALPCWE